MSNYWKLVHPRNPDIFFCLLTYCLRVILSYCICGVSGKRTLWPEKWGAKKMCSQSSVWKNHSHPAHAGLHCCCTKQPAMRIVALNSPIEVLTFLRNLWALDVALVKARLNQLPADRRPRVPDWFLVLGIFQFLFATTLQKCVVNNWRHVESTLECAIQENQQFRKNKKRNKILNNHATTFLLTIHFLAHYASCCQARSFTVCLSCCNAAPSAQCISLSCHGPKGSKSYRWLIRKLIGKSESNFKTNMCNILISYLIHLIFMKW